MRASRAVDLDADIVPAPAPRAAPIDLFLRSLAPALDTAFGIEHASLLPEALSALAARLQAGLPGSEAATPSTSATAALNAR